MKTNKQSLKHPQMRILLLDSLKDLSDRDYQLNNWFSKTAAHRFWDSLRFPIEIIFDTVLLEEDPEGQIGYSLYNQAELEAVSPVVRALGRVMNEVGMEQPDEVYIQSPLWDEVVQTAQHAFKVLMEKEVMTEEYKDYWNRLRQAFYKNPIPL